MNKQSIMIVVLLLLLFLTIIKNNKKVIIKKFPISDFQQLYIYIYIYIYVCVIGDEVTQVNSSLTHLINQSLD